MLSLILLVLAFPPLENKKVENTYISITPKVSSAVKTDALFCQIDQSFSFINKTLKSSLSEPDHQFIFTDLNGPQPILVLRVCDPNCRSQIYPLTFIEEKASTIYFSYKTLKTVNLVSINRDTKQTLLVFFVYSEIAVVASLSCKE